jgi:hypothetical protein
MIEQTTPKYPIYILSKGRYEYCHTMKALDKMGLKYFVAVEPQEFEKYKAALNPDNATVLELPFSNHGMGGGPARNWIWEHSVAHGAKRHWILDDNISEFWRYHNNKRYRCESGSIFRVTEDFVDRFKNVMLSGLQYKFFVVDNSADYHPFVLNTRLMSCILIQNDCPHKWRGKYNEDVDLSIRVLKDGYCTVLMYAFLAGKMGTQTLKGGNTEEIYGDGTFEKSKMLVNLHPDVVELKQRYGRWHHHADLSGFKANKLIPVDNYDEIIAKLPESNEYGMIFVKDAGPNQTVISLKDKNFSVKKEDV